MIRSFIVCVMLALSSSAFDSRLMASIYGDARVGGSISNTSAYLMFDVLLPPGEHHGLTVCAWFRLPGKSDVGQVTTMSHWTPEAVEYINPDLTAGAFGYPTNLVLSGSITITNFPFATYTDSPSMVSNLWPSGVMTISGVTSNEVTLSLGGTDYTVGPGLFTRNYIPGPSDSVVVSGTGTISIGISRVPCYEFFSLIDGVNSGEDMFLSAESTVTNEIAFCVWRIKLDETEHLYRSDLTRIDRSTNTGILSTNAMPRSARSMSSRGIYRFGLGSPFIGMQRPVEVFDGRSFTRWLTDEEVWRIHQNGVEEIARRGIPRWK